MAYQYNIPLATDQLSKSQGDIQGNFNVLGAIAGNGNIASSSLNGTVGFNFVYLASQAGAIPPITFPAANIALYSATDPVTTKNELYINKTNQATVVQIPATGSILSTVSSPGNNSAGWSYLPSGLLMMWNTVSVPTGGSPGPNTPIPFPTGAGIPVFSQVFQILLTPTINSTSTSRSYSIQLGTVTTTNFKVSWTGNAVAGDLLSFLAIGIPTAY
jgi:hypothetical protein